MPAYRISLGFSAKKKNSHFCMDFHVRGLSSFKRFAEIAHGTTRNRDISRPPLKPPQFFKLRNVIRSGFYVFL